MKKKHSITPWPATIVATALLAIPAPAWTQTGSTSPQPRANTSEATQDNSPEAHLRKARTALAVIKTGTLSPEAQAKLQEIERRLGALERRVAAAEAAEAAAASRSDLREIDLVLVTLIGPDPASRTTGTAGAAGTSGTRRETVILVDEPTRQSLTELRRHLSAFAASRGLNATPGPHPSEGGVPNALLEAAAPQPAGRTPQATSGSQSEEALRHIRAIEAILNAATAGMSGATTPPTAASVTLSREQIDQLRTHLAELKRTMQ